MRTRAGDFAQPVAPAPTAGDTPADHPGMSRAPKYHPPATIQVVRPDRTIVRNVTQALPTVLAGSSRWAAPGSVLLRTRSAGRRHGTLPLTPGGAPALDQRGPRKRA